MYPVSYFMRISCILLGLFLFSFTDLHAQKMQAYSAFSKQDFNSALHSHLNFDRNFDSKRFGHSCRLLNQDSLPVLARFAYTNLVMLSSSIAGHAYLVLRTHKTEDWSSKYSWQSIERTFTLPPKWDEDHWSFNYLVHPYMGSLTYLAWRNRGGSPLSGLLVSGLNSTLYEYLIASAIQRPSANDLIITPLTGAILGEAIFFIEKKILGQKYLSVTEKIILTIIDPYEVARNRFRYNKMIR